MGEKNDVSLPVPQSLSSNQISLNAHELEIVDLCINNLVSDNIQAKKPIISQKEHKYTKKNNDSHITTKLKKLSIRRNDTYNILDLSFSEKIKVFRQNKGNRLIRIRIKPAIDTLTDNKKNKLNKEFERFSIHSSNNYSELIFESAGKIGNPYIASDTSNIYRLCIPYQSTFTKFPLKNIKKVSQHIYYLQERATVNGLTSDAHVLKITRPEHVNILPTLAKEGIARRETLSSMAKRRNAIAAINGAFFAPNGDPLGTLIINRQLLSSPLFDRSVFGICQNKRPVFGNPIFDGQIKTDNFLLSIDGVNQPLRQNQVVIYTPAYARNTLTQNSDIELAIVRSQVVRRRRNNTIIPPDGIVLSASGNKALPLKNLPLGARLTISYSVNNPWSSIIHAVSGGPQLISDGEIKITDVQEKFSGALVNNRHPRTAVAETFNGELLMVVIDGRSKRSAGMTLRELASYLKKLGAKQAINLDGGGSSSMFVKDKIVNRPSGGRERGISNGILVMEYQ